MAYGKYRHSTIKGQAGTTWEVEVWKKDNYNQVKNGEFTTDLSDWSNINSWTWVNNNGIGGVQTTGSGSISQAQVVLPFFPSVGDEIEGGVVLHVSATDVYVIAKESIGQFEWGCSGTYISGADGQAIGTGLQNTLDIVAGCSATDSAAYMCSDLTLNGYSDWFLPSKDELHKFYQNKSTLEAVSGFESFSGAYWSSTESSSSLANYEFPSMGSSSVISKTNTFKVRPIRSYPLDAYYVNIDINSRTQGYIEVDVGGTTSSQITTNGVTSIALVAGIVGNVTITAGGSFDGVISDISVSLNPDFQHSKELNLSGEGFEVKWTGEGGTRDKQFIASECVLNMFVESQDDEDWLYNDVFQKGDNYHYIRIYKNSVSDTNLWWYGWIQPGFDVIENSPFPYEFKLTATDSYGYFGKKKPSEFTSQEEKVEAHKIKDLLISDFGIDMSLIAESNGNTAVNSPDGNLSPNPYNRDSFKTSVDWWRPETTYQSSDPLAIHYAARGAFVEKQDEEEEDISESNPLEYKPIDVVNGVLKTFNTVGFLAEGFYNFIQPNSFVDNNTGEIRVYDYEDTTSSPTPYDLDTLLTIDQSNNAVLGGSTITYEPSLEGVRLTYKQGANSFNVASGQDLTSSTLVGMVQSLDEGTMTLDFNAKHIEEIDRTEFSGLNPASYPHWHILDNSFVNQATLTISITDGSTTKYLQEDSGGLLTWSGSPQTIIIYRGWGIGAAALTGVNSTSNTAVGNVSNGTSLNIGSSATSYPQSTISGGPCYSSYYNSADKYKFTTNIKFLAEVENPGITGDINIELDAFNYYHKAKSGALIAGVYSTEFGLQSQPTSIESSSTECVNITLTPTGSESWAEQGESIVYSSEQTENTSYESFDLGDYNLGQTGIGSEYSVQYLSSGITTPVTTGFQRGNPTPDNPRNILQLVTKEFLELQVEPLEILQASIFSSDISPLKTIKYSINDDSNYKYYQFLGGSFKAQSETMDGEWYSINSKTDYITEPNPFPVVTNELAPPPPPNGSAEGKMGSTDFNAQIDLINKSLGVTDSDIDLGTTYNKVEFDANSKAKVYDNQKIILSYADGSNQLILTASGDNLTSSDQINVDNFTPTTNYPSGCVVSILPYDLTNVIQGENLAPGVTTTAIYITPQQFHTTNDSNMVMYSRDDLGSIQGTEYDRKLIYATTFIPLGYKIKAVDIYASANESIEIKTCRVADDYTTSRGTGTSNTQLITSAWASVEGYYVILIYGPGATSDEIYGAKITIEAI